MSLNDNILDSIANEFATPQPSGVTDPVLNGTGDGKSDTKKETEYVVIAPAEGDNAEDTKLPLEEVLTIVEDANTKIATADKDSIFVGTAEEVAKTVLAMESISQAESASIDMNIGGLYDNAVKKNEFTVVPTRAGLAETQQYVASRLDQAKEQIKATIKESILDKANHLNGLCQHILEKDLNRVLGYVALAETGQLEFLKMLGSGHSLYYHKQKDTLEPDNSYSRELSDITRVDFLQFRHYDDLPDITPEILKAITTMGDAVREDIFKLFMKNVVKGSDNFFYSIPGNPHDVTSCPPETTWSLYRMVTNNWITEEDKRDYHFNDYYHLLEVFASGAVQRGLLELKASMELDRDLFNMYVETGPVALKVTSEEKTYEPLPHAFGERLLAIYRLLNLLETVTVNFVIMTDWLRVLLEEKK